MKHNITFLLVVAGFVNSASQLIRRALPTCAFIETAIDCTVVSTGEQCENGLTRPSNNECSEGGGTRIQVKFVYRICNKNSRAKIKKGTWTKLQKYKKQIGTAQLSFSPAKDPPYLCSSTKRRTRINTCSKNNLASLNVRAQVPREKACRKYSFVNIVPKVPCPCFSADDLTLPLTNSGDLECIAQVSDFVDSNGVRSSGTNLIVIDFDNDDKTLFGAAKFSDPEKISSCESNQVTKEDVDTQCYSLLENLCNALNVPKIPCPCFSADDLTLPLTNSGDLKCNKQVIDFVDSNGVGSSGTVLDVVDNDDKTLFEASKFSDPEKIPSCESNQVSKEDVDTQCYSLLENLCNALNVPKVSCPCFSADDLTLPLTNSGDLKCNMLAIDYLDSSSGTVLEFYNDGNRLFEASKFSDPKKIPLCASNQVTKDDVDKQCYSLLENLCNALKQG